MVKQKAIDFDDVVKELRKDSQFRKAQRRVAPYFDLALEIIKRRLDLGLTQNDLAKKAKTYQSRISKIESGEHDIRLSTLIDIAEALQCEITKNVLVPVETIEFEDESDFYWVFNTETYPIKSYIDYTKAEDYQPA